MLPKTLYISILGNNVFMVISGVYSMIWVWNIHLSLFNLLQIIDLLINYVEERTTFKTYIAIFFVADNKSTSV